MEYILMHKDDVVANVEFTDSGLYSHINGFYNRKLMPVGTRVADRYVDARFKNWLKQRIMAKERETYTIILNDSCDIELEQLVIKNYGLSLNDNYWFKRKEKVDLNPRWKHINFFKNEFSNYVGDLLIYNKTNETKKYISPDLTTNGTNDKRWKYDKDKIYLYKYPLKEYNNLEIANEVICSYICELLKIDCVKYTLVDDYGYLAVKCECFCNENIEFFSGLNLSIENNTLGKTGVLKYIKDNKLEKQLDKLIVLDYITNNSDRDLTNIGFLRDANTLEVKKIAPLFDNGKCLWYDYKIHSIGTLDESKLFEATHQKQLDLVTDFSWINFDNLNNIGLYIEDIYKKIEFDEIKTKEIIDALYERIENLKIYIKNKNDNIREEKKLIKEAMIKEEKEKTKKALLSNFTTGGFGFE